MHERTFTRGEVTVTTQTPARATQLIAEGWEEVHDWPTERPEPTHRFERETGEVVDVPTVESKSVTRRRRVERGEPVTPTE